MTVLQQILKHQIVAIIRGANPDDVVHIARALNNGGINILEITMNSEEPLRVIKEVSDALGDKMVIGAGTVLDAQTARDAVAAGAKFILSPMVDEDVIKTAKSLGVVCIPGAYTATEIFTAHRLGGDIIKVFPATSPSYIKDIRGPLPHIPLLPTGGITPQNITEFKKAGAVGFGIGSALVNTKEAITTEYLLQLTEKARAFTLALNA
jgi:2-dehydro-3-deoxyphosphogluconate aldolase/(4S)-4-hydroxy-2-oxoglutarate aldolase